MEVFPEDHLLLVGSCSESMSMRNLFNYRDRCDFIRKLFPECTIAGIPDFDNDEESWFQHLDHLIELTGGDPKETAFLGGCEEDVAWYYRMNRNVHIVNRFSGITTNVSGTEIRDHLIHRNTEKLGKLVDGQILEMVQDRFNQRWDELRHR